MDELIETVNHLQEVFAAAEVSVQALDLPQVMYSWTGVVAQPVDLAQVVVVGAQSSGKSSVLEHLVGRSFLPRGPGVVTRCPLELQLVHTPAQTKQPVNEYAIFQHSPSKVFTDHRLIGKEIEEQTQRLAGTNKGICSTPISLRIYSGSQVQLTLVDLPGLTKVPVSDQPADIEHLTRQLTLRYVTNPNCIILAVTPANADMATCESLKISREVDPEGARTVAVVTKLDLMDNGTDGRDMLVGRVIPVRLGIIGVVNRSQQDIVEGKSVKQSLKDESTFFYNKYRDIASFHGSHYLTKTVQAILIDRIGLYLPKLKERINLKLSTHQRDLRLLGESKLDKPTLLLDLMTKFSATYCSTIKGNLANIQTKELHGGARINYVFQESLTMALNSIDPVAGLSKAAILTALQNASGVTPALFVPEVAFELLVKRQIQRLRSPCLQCVELVHEELVRIARHCVDDPDTGLHRFPNLHAEIYRVATELMRNRLPVTNEMVDHFIDIQLAYINTSHPDFLANSAQGLSRALTGPPEETPDKASRDCRLIQDLIQSYFSIVRKSIQDVVPKMIMHLMVNHAVERLQAELVGRLFCRSDADQLLREGESAAVRRAELAATVAVLTQALGVLADRPARPRSIATPLPLISKPPALNNPLNA